MYEHSCKNAGAQLCTFRTSAGSEAELRARLGDHVRAKHRVENLTDTIYAYLRSVASR